MASRLHYYEHEELIELARQAGFEDTRSENPNLEQFARESEVLGEALHLFSGGKGSSSCQL
jgi:hypothetical protein